jgi:hypothetical protein
MDLDYWKTSDKEWLSARKKEWPNIVKSLKTLDGRVKTKYHKYHKELFLEGTVTINENEKELAYGPAEAFEREIFGYARIVFNMWYHPAAEEEIYREILEEEISNTNGARNKVKVIENNRRYLMESQSADGFDSEYGMMGGREKLMTRVLFPSDDYSDTRDFGGNGEASEVLHLAPQPSEVRKLVLSGTNPILCDKRGDRNRFAPGQYLWDALDKSMHKMESGYFDKYFVRMLYMIKHQEKVKKFAADNPNAVALANHLKCRFDNREFGPALMNCWNNIEDLYKEHCG